MKKTNYIIMLMLLILSLNAMAVSIGETKITNIAKEDSNTIRVEWQSIINTASGTETLNDRFFVPEHYSQREIEDKFIQESMQTYNSKYVPVVLAEDTKITSLKTNLKNKKIDAIVAEREQEELNAKSNIQLESGFEEIIITEPTPSFWDKIKWFFGFA